MAFSILVAVLTLSSVSLALFEDAAEPCTASLKALIEKHGGKTAQVNPELPLGPYSRHVSFPTQVIGQRIRVFEGDGLSARVVIEDAAMEESFQQDKDCTIRSVGSEKRRQPKSFFTFSDADLKKLLVGKESVLIYSWSPTLTYSKKYWHWFHEAAKAHRLKFIPVLEEQVSDERLQANLNHWRLPADFKRLNLSNELKSLGSGVHSPSAFVIVAGRMPARPYYGVLDRATLDKRIKAAKNDP